MTVLCGVPFGQILSIQRGTLGASHRFAVQRSIVQRFGPGFLSPTPVVALFHGAPAYASQAPPESRFWAPVPADPGKFTFENGRFGVPGASATRYML